jgi:predicted hydrolase (HD superfamily)
MEKMLYTIDELSGLVNATALMRPEKLKGISVKSVKKKWKDKGFAAGVNREVITQGCQMLELSQEEIIQLVIDGMTDVAPQLGLWD